jgi:Amt family ammonium transporter
VWSFGVAFLLFKLLSKTVGLRVSAEEEIEGLDLAEHGNQAYPTDAVGTVVEPEPTAVAVASASTALASPEPA